MNEYGDLSPEKRREIRLALQMNECQFDCDTVSAYLQQEDRKVDNLMSTANQGTDFQSYIRVKSRQRVERLYDGQFKSIVDEAKVIENEKYLHPGF